MLDGRRHPESLTSTFGRGKFLLWVTSLVGFLLVREVFVVECFSRNFFDRSIATRYYLLISIKSEVCTAVEFSGDGFSFHFEVPSVGDTLDILPLI